MGRLLDRRMAVLIDGDFVQPACLDRIMAEAARHGRVAIRRAYGNTPKMFAWQDCFRRHRITIIPNHADSANAADHTLMMDAVEMLCSGRKIDGFCIVASDDHFAGLANWLRKKGVFVVGIGGLKTSPALFKAGCDEFEYVERLPECDTPDPVARKMLSRWKKAVKKAVAEHAGNDDGWARLSVIQADVGNINPRDYCQSKLFRLIESCPEFQTKKPDLVRLNDAKS